MTKILWDQVGERVYETGVDRGVLYLPDSTSGEYDEGFAWNGLISVTESPSGAEANPQYADNIKYVNLYSAEEFGATIEAFTYPDEFALCDGSASPSAGVTVAQQRRRSFGLSYRSLIGNDTEGTDHGYKIHLVYGAMAAPSEKSRTTVNDSPEAMTFSWELTTTPVPVEGTDADGNALRPTAHITIDSREVDEDDLTALEELLYGTTEDEASLPTPTEVIALFATP